MHRHLQIILSLLLISSISIPVFAGQETVYEEKPQKEQTETEKSKDSTRTYYIEISGTVNAVNGLTAATFNLAKSLKSAPLTTEQKKNANRDFRFASMAEAMNALASHGWKLAQSYSATVRNVTTIYWVASKEVTDMEELLEGFAKVEK